MGDNIQIGSNANVNIRSTINESKQIIGTPGLFSDDRGKSLAALVDEFEVELKKLEKEDPGQAKSLADHLHRVIEASRQTQEKGGRDLLQVSAEGLMSAAKAVASIVPTLLPK